MLYLELSIVSFKSLFTLPYRTSSRSIPVMSAARTIVGRIKKGLAVVTNLNKNQIKLVVYQTRRYLWSLDRIRNLSVELVIPEDQYSINDWITQHKAESRGFSSREGDYDGSY